MHKAAPAGIQKAERFFYAFFGIDRAGVFCLPESFMRAALRRIGFTGNAKEFRAIFCLFPEKYGVPNSYILAMIFCGCYNTGITKSRGKRGKRT